MEYSAVIFDLDGTLLNSLADIAEAANRVFAARHWPTHSVSSYRAFVGNGVEVLMQRAMPASQCNAETIADCSEQFRQVYSQTWNLSTAPYSGIPNLLKELAQRQIPLGILSNKPHRNTIDCVNAFFDAETFSLVFGQRQDVPCKPDPRAALEIADEWGIPPTDCLFVGDSNVDMQTAVNAGMNGIGVTWGFRTRAELLESGACLAIDHPADLLNLADLDSQ